MTIKLENFKVSRHKLGQFKEVLVATNGIFLANPVFFEDGSAAFSFSFNDIDSYSEFHRRWESLTTEIREKRSDQGWKRALRRIGVSL